jgi:quercetin dioxygenase-like cupin family protein
VTDLGGEPPCWAHLLDEPDIHQQPDHSTHVDISRVGDDGSGAVWSLPHGGDLDANLIRLEAGEEIGRHVNSAVDVFIVVWDGGGEITIDDRTLSLQPGVAVLVHRGALRSIKAGRDGIRYLTVHRRRDPLTIGRH